LQHKFEWFGSNFAAYLIGCISLNDYFRIYDMTGSFFLLWEFNKTPTADLKQVAFHWIGMRVAEGVAVQPQT
jgi:hypothetical protein